MISYVLLLSLFLAAASAAHPKSTLNEALRQVIDSMINDGFIDEVRKILNYDN